jgi:hypothetical protein
MATLKGFPDPGRHGRCVSWGGLPAPSTPFTGWMVVRAVGSYQGMAGVSGVSVRLYEQPLPK